MRDDINENENNILIILSIMKIAVIVFISIIIYINAPSYSVVLNIKNNDEFSLCSATLLFCFLVLTFVTWIIINLKLKLVAKSSWLIENIFFILIISLPIYLFNTYNNECKYLFLLLITCSVIKYGLRYGILTSLFSSIFVLGADLLYAPTANGINMDFQKDLIMVGIFIFIAWVLGYYVELENENKRKKDNQLKLLSTELEEQNTERRIIEESLLKNKVCYDILFENSQNAIIVHADGKVLYANKSAARLLGYEDPLQLNNKLVYKYYSQNNIMSTKEKYLNIVSDKLSKVTYEETILNCKGNSIAVRNTSSFYIYEGKPSVLTFLLDITSEKQIETLKHDVEKNLKLLNESREFNVLITEFFTNISHEFKTPVNVISIAIQTMNIYFENFNIDNIDKCKSYLKIMKQNCFRMTRLINNLMDITRVDSGFVKVNKRNDNIVSIIEDITQSVASYVKSKDIELIFDTNVEEKIMAFDHDKIERVILNLLSNAFKYTNPNGHIYVNLEDREESVIITVKDDGQGIPQNMINVIFERFGQANRSLSRQCEGTGIGLYLVKSFIEIHGGKISVTSEEGKGCEFTIVLPAEYVNNENYEDKAFCESNVERINIEFSDVYSISI
ncbi:PAS domain-containing sensor histidine kinase [Clostridium aciditolerans]|uniref:histidine kinase n=1 Tax=Clostridium aciditolerans TaxID=339861 RepID=A0A934M571_9CLOT|nr:PAS domain-containing sensor histidine kinase [Clostridium aciditolerans]MBI6874785.1 PAS domain S-box protein [Clostridium aciditolerans]